MPNIADLMDHEIAMLAKTFVKFSEDGETLETDFIGPALRSMKLIPTEAQIDHYTEKYDNNGFITQENFLAMGADCWMDDKTLEETFWNAFLQFDNLDRGKIDVETFRKILTEMGEPIPEKEAEMIIKNFAGKDGFIAYPQIIAQWSK